MVRYYIKFNNIFKNILHKERCEMFFKSVCVKFDYPYISYTLIFNSNVLNVELNLIVNFDT